MDSGNYLLQPGYIYVPEKAVSISTVIGSGVAVCIFNKKTRIGGMNHFQLPFMSAKGKTTAMYGNIATITLIKMMLSFNQRTRVKNLEAQIFGGAYNPENSDKDVGKQNIEMAHKILNQNQIAIISEDTGGKKGRKVVFNISTNEAAVLKVDNLRDADWYPYQ
ncbi:MAG: chemotaxis protein CheD [Desulfobacula sp.]|nr:chemotaxis protein CheD [Desulfobacula sp.]